jgi:hypothetical protein
MSLKILFFVVYNASYQSMFTELQSQWENYNLLLVLIQWLQIEARFSYNKRKYFVISDNTLEMKCN